MEEKINQTQSEVFTHAARACVYMQIARLRCA